MRLTVLFLTALGLTFATNAGITDVCGVWVAVIDRCNFQTGSRPVRLALSVTLNDNRLNVIEVLTGEDGANLAERQYLLGNHVEPNKSRLGSARIFGRAVILEWSDRLENWRITNDGSELTVSRRIGASPAIHQILVFRRSSEISIVSPSGQPK